MKSISSILLVFLFVNHLNSQSSCSELIDYIKSESYGTTYSSFGSEAISSVTFYQLNDDNYNTYYYAVVKFSNSYNEYIYQVASNTKSNYSF